MTQMAFTILNYK